VSFDEHVEVYWVEIPALQIRESGDVSWSDRLSNPLSKVGAIGCSPTVATTLGDLA
jgi:hypothetical protein